MKLYPVSRKGFTLLEALIAILITSIIAAGILTALRGGIAAYRKLSRSSIEINEARMTFTLIEKELRNMLSYSKVPFLGNATQFSFPALVTKFEGSQTTQVPVAVTYEYREQTLFRREIPLRDFLATSRESSKKIIPSLKKFSVEYAYRGSKSPDVFWRDSWEKESGLPKGLRITLVLEEPREKKAKAKAQTFTFTKEFYIPQGNWGWREKDLSL